ncbi:MAG: cytochrome c [Armatimonadetes bacterium]|nr:cytochrome c [Armatimonadota bacterium]
MSSPIQRIVIGGIWALALAVSLATAVAAAAPYVNPIRGRQLFKTKGCVSCHKVYGVPGRGTAGPNLSHVGKELTAAEIARQIKNPKAKNPHTRMPAATDLKPSELRALSVWLASLK